MVLSERDLLERFRAGDEEALETIYRACIDRVTRIADAVLRACATSKARGKGEVATAVADIVQEVFVKAFAPDARARFDAAKPFEPYLAQITRNVAIDHWRQMRRYVPCDIDRLIDKLAMETDNDDDSGADEWSDDATVALVSRYLASLNEKARRVHDALYVKGMTQQGAADLLGLGRQGIRTAEAKLRSGLREELSRAAGTGTIGHPAAARPTMPVDVADRSGDRAAHEAPAGNDEDERDGNGGRGRAVVRGIGVRR
jgi:RNA polymerase sigma factor (sigma-70 family)